MQASWLERLIPRSGMKRPILVAWSDIESEMNSYMDGNWLFLDSVFCIISDLVNKTELAKKIDEIGQKLAW